MIHRRDISPGCHYRQKPFEFRAHRFLSFEHHHLVIAAEKEKLGVILTDGPKVVECPELTPFWKKWTNNSYGYNFQFMSGTEADEMMVSLPSYSRLQPEIAVLRPAHTISVSDAGRVDKAKYAALPPEEWAPQYDNPGSGRIAFPGNQGWASWPGGTPPDGPVPLARHVGGYVNNLFFDGHVEPIGATALLSMRRGDPECVWDNE